MGDFSYRDIDYKNYRVNTDTNTEAYKFFPTTEDLYLVQNVTEDTRKREGTKASVLDYIFTDEDRLVDNLHYETPLGKSDHVCLTWDYVVKVKEQRSVHHTLNYWKGNYKQIKDDMQVINWQELLSEKTTEEAWSCFKQLLRNSVEKNVPVREISRRKLRKNPWITKSTKRKITKTDKAWRKYRIIPTDATYNEYKSLRNEANKQVKADQASYRKKILKSFKGRPKKFYGYMQRLRTVKDKVAQLTMDDGTLSSTDYEAAETLAKFFSSVFVKEADMEIDDGDNDQGEDENLNIIINEERVRNKLLQLHEDKAQGPDDIHPAVLRNCAEAVSRPLSMIFIKSLREGVLPGDWKEAIVSPIYKKRETRETRNPDRSWQERSG